MNGDTPSDGRLLVLESDTKRHEDCLNKIDERLRKVEGYVDVVEEIRHLLKVDVIPELKTLTHANIAASSAAEAAKVAKDGDLQSPLKKLLWKMAEVAVIAIIAWGFTVNQNLGMGK